MDNDKKVTVNFKGGGLCTLLTIAFIVLKLCGVISWSWIWVLAPLWIGWALIFIIAIVCAITLAIVNHFY